MLRKLQIENPYAKNVLYAVAVAVFGFILLNLTFLFDFLFQSIIDRIIGVFIPIDEYMTWPWFPSVKHFMFVIVILLISWFIFKSKIRDIYKATFLTVPSAVILVTVGIFFYQLPVIVYLVSSLLITGILYYFYYNKKPWLYYYAVILVALALIIMTLTGAEI